MEAHGRVPERVVGGHAAHHFVPRFLLAQWESGPDQKLSRYQWVRDTLRHDRRKAKSVAKVRHLYSRMRDTATPDVTVEREFMGPEVDDPAAVVHAKMLRLGLRGLSPEDRVIWSRFIVSLMLRGPRMMDNIRARGRAILMKSVTDQGKDPDIDEGYDSLLSWVMAECPWEMDDLGVRALPMLVNSEKLNAQVMAGHWATRPIVGSDLDLLISDRPLLIAGDYKSSYVIAMPISPRRLFVAFNDTGTWDRMSKKSSKQLVKDSNLDTVVNAERVVFATGQQHETFIRKRGHHLRGEPAEASG
jgi:hypothetical protein